jgi:hypothetical protein
MKDRTMRKSWVPSPLEQKCLQHLDAPGSWKVLKTSLPQETDVLNWRPFRRIFGFNLVLFSIVFIAIFFGLERTVETDALGIKEDLPYGMGVALLLAVSFAFYVTHLYRRSWNSRARSIQRLAEEGRGF